MKNIILSVYKPGRSEIPEKTITIPLTTLNSSIQLLPKKIITILEREGIDIRQCSDLIKEKDHKGTLIEVENPTERLVISVE